MQIVRNVPRYVNLPKFFATLAASDNPLASTYSSDNFSLLSLILFNTYANFQPCSETVFLVRNFTSLNVRPRIKLPMRLLTIGVPFCRQQSNLFQVRNFMNRGMLLPM